LRSLQLLPKPKEGDNTTLTPKIQKGIEALGGRKLDYLAHMVEHLDERTLIQEVEKLDKDETLYLVAALAGRILSLEGDKKELMKLRRRAEAYRKLL
jgi:hypothetical protein